MLHDELLLDQRGYPQDGDGTHDGCAELSEDTSATLYDTAKERLIKAGVFGLFDKVISAHMVERGKPYPDVYLYAASALSLKPEECIAVEDSPNGVLSAYRAGCKTVMVPDLTEPDEDLKKLLYGIAHDLTGLKEII